jgi:hypothetical protein
LSDSATKLADGNPPDRHPFPASGAVSTSARD